MTEKQLYNRAVQADLIRNLSATYAKDYAVLAARAARCWRQYAKYTTA